MSEQTFGAWLLKQQDRQDTTGTLARAWKQLRDARGYNRHTKVKSIRELLSASLGEDWQALRGDESVAAAEAEWKADGSEAPQDALIASGGSIDYIPEQPHTGALASALPMAVLYVDGKRYELTLGKAYTLSLGPVLREGEQLTEQAAPSAVLPDGRMDMAALYGIADHEIPAEDDLVSLGLIDQGWTE